MHPKPRAASRIALAALLTGTAVCTTSVDAQTPVRRAASEREAAGSRSAVNMAAVRRAISAAESQQASALKRGDIDGALQIYTEDVVALWPGEPVIRGRAALREAAVRAFGGATLTTAKSTTDDILVSGDVAVATVSFDNTWTKGGEAVRQAGRGIVVWRRQPDGSWRVSRDISNQGPPEKR